MLSGWARRLEILFFLSQSGMKSYAHDRVLGFLWWIFDPLFQIVIYIILMEKILRSGQEKFPFFLACAVIPWRFLAHGTCAAGSSLLVNAGLLKSVNIDRVYMPVSEVINSFVYFLYALPTFGILMICYRVPPTIHILWLPIIVAALTAMVVGIGLFLSMATVYLRNAENLWLFFLQAWFFLSPTLYPLEMVPPAWRKVFMLNPAAGLIDAFRRSLLYGTALDLSTFLPAAAVSFLVLGLGIAFFRRTENEAMRLL